MDSPASTQDAVTLRDTSPPTASTVQSKPRGRRPAKPKDLAPDSTMGDPKRLRIRYMAEENLALIRLCVKNRFLYKRPVMKFWNMIATLFTSEVGKPMAAPLGKVNKMVKEREEAIARQRLESGTIQEESDYTQAVDIWRSVLQQAQDEKDKRWEIQKE